MTGVQTCALPISERGINYRTEDFVEVVKSLTGGKGANVIIDMVAGDYVNREINCLADDGRLVIIALLGGSKGEVNFGEIMRRRSDNNGGAGVEIIDIPAGATTPVSIGQK